jgi:hypothetical protein
MAHPTASLQPDPFATEAAAATAHLPPGHADRRWQVFDRLVIAAFVIGLLVPALTLAIGLRSRPIENRPLLEVPAPALGAIADASWMVGVDAAIADNLKFRQYAIRIRGEVEWLTGGTGNPNVLRGRDGWLFIAGEFAPSCRFDADQLLEAFRTGSTALKAAGQDAHLLVIPDKHAVYPDKVATNPFPPSCVEVGRAKLAAGLAAMAPGAVDGQVLREAARAADPAGPLLFFPLDSHWTPTGATAVIEGLITSIDPRLWSDEDVDRSGRSRLRTDLGAQMGIRRSGTVAGVAIRRALTVTRTDVEVPVEVSNARSVFRTTSTGPLPVVPGRTVIVYDSFFGIDVPLVAPFFADATWIHVGDMLNHPELAKLTGPFDHVIVERVARGLYATDLDAILTSLVR